MMRSLGCASWEIDTGKLLLADERFTSFFGIRVGGKWESLTCAPADLPLACELLFESRQQIAKSLSVLFLHGTQRLSTYLLAREEVLVSAQLELKLDQFISSNIAYQCVHWQVWCESEVPVKQVRLLEVRQLSLPRRHSSGKLSKDTELCMCNNLPKLPSPGPLEQ